MSTTVKYLLSLVINVLLIHITTVNNCNATIYYSRGSGNWNAAATWSTVTYGNATNTGTYPVIGDMAYVGDGHTILLVSASQCSGLDIGQGTSGIVEYPNFGSITLTISGTLTINNGGKLWYNYNTTRTHNLFISASITNNGTLRLYADNNDVVNMTLNGAANCTVTGAGTFSFNIVTVSKGTTSYFVDIQSAAFLTAAPPAAIAPRMDMIKGTIVCNTASVTTWSDPTATSYTIPMNVVLEVRTGNISMLTNGDTLINSGKIFITGGNLQVGSPAGTKGILNKVAGAVTPSVEITSGTLMATGGLSSYPGGGNPWIFKITNGNLDINSGTTRTDLIPLYLENTAGSQFLCTGGNIYIRKPSTTANTAEIDFGSSNVYHNVTDGHIYFGDATTAYNFDYMPYVSYAYPNFEVAGVAGTMLHPKSAISSKMLSIKVNPGNIFDVSTSASNATSTSISLISTLDGVYGIYNDGTFEERLGTLSFTGAVAQHIYSVAGEDRFYNMLVNNAAGVYLDKPTSIGGTITFTNGIVYSDPVNLLTINAGAGTASVSNTSYVKGPVKKIGSTAFTYPVGDVNMFRSIGISAPSVISDEYIAEYHFTTPDPTYNRTSHVGSLDHISDMEYWTLTRNAGASNVFITLSWNAASGGVTSLPLLSVAQWDGAIWQDNGNASTTGNVIAGTITSSVAATIYGPFSLSSTTSGSNPLPIDLANFHATPYYGYNKISWQTLSEKNNDYFELEKSADGKTFDLLKHIPGAGHSSVLLNYETTDNNPCKPVTYYRLKQVDYNGDCTYSVIKSIRNNNYTSASVLPTIIRNENIIVDFGEAQFLKGEIIITDVTGNVVFKEPVHDRNVTIDKDVAKFNKTGMYFIQLIADDTLIHTGRLVVM